MAAQAESLPLMNALLFTHGGLARESSPGARLRGSGAGGSGQGGRDVPSRSSALRRVPGREAAVIPRARGGRCPRVAREAEGFSSAFPADYELFEMEFQMIA